MDGGESDAFVESYQYDYAVKPSGKPVLVTTSGLFISYSIFRSVQPLLPP